MAEKSVDKSEKMTKRMANLKPFTPLNAKEMAALSTKVRQMRKQMRAKLLETAVNEGLDNFFAKAIKNMDVDAIAVVEKAAKLVGLDFGSSEEAVTKVDVKSDAKVDSTLKVTIEEVK